MLPAAWRGVAQVLFFHYPLRGGMAFPHYWSEAEALTFAKAIRNHNVIALVHGHTHSCVFHRWDLSNSTGRSYDVFNAPALQKGGATDALLTPSQYLVFEIDDTARTLRVFQRVGSGWGTIMHESTYGHTAPGSGGSRGTRTMAALRGDAYGGQGQGTRQALGWWRTTVVAADEALAVPSSSRWVP